VLEIGASLTAARQARGLELRDAERLTCLRARYLLALEHEQYDQLPGRTYARAFLRTYANALGLHADRLVAEFDEQVPDTDPPLIPPLRRRRRRSWRPVAVGAAAIVVVGVVGWTERPGGNNAADTGNVSAASVVGAPNTSRAKSAPQHHVKAAHKTVTAPTLVTVKATGDCWILARRGSSTGDVLAEQTLHEGDVLRLHASRVWLRLGAPANVQVDRGTHVLRDLPGAEPMNVTV